MQLCESMKADHKFILSGTIMVGLCIINFSFLFKFSCYFRASAHLLAELSNCTTVSDKDNARAEMAKAEVKHLEVVLEGISAELSVFEVQANEVEGRARASFEAQKKTEIKLASKKVRGQEMALRVTEAERIVWEIPFSEYPSCHL